MPVDYSKWDNLELSDDSDIEVHPNVDKKSFIRAKQNQIHQQRLDRKHHIATLGYERIINDGLLSRIDALLVSLKSHEEQARARSDSIEAIVFQSLLESAGPREQDRPPAPPPGVHAEVSEQPTYSKMMAALVDQVKQAVDKAKPADRFQGFVDEVGVHKDKVESLQKELLAKLAELEKEEKRKITSADIHYGFDSSSVSKSSSEPKASSRPELLNPGRPALLSGDRTQTTGSDADVEDEGRGMSGALGDMDDDDMKASPLAKRFGNIKFGDYKSSLQFISGNPAVLREKETDGLLVEAFNEQTEGRDDKARQCVHQALLLQYCRQLGKDGVGLFFKRVTTPGHQAQKLFLDDVNTTYARIRTRCKELAEQEAADDQGGVEQIQLHAVDPNTTLHITVPPVDCKTEEEIQSRFLFESFPPGLQRALESGQLDKINEVLGKMSVDEAEEVVEKLGSGGMLSVEGGVIDATTEEGKRQVEEIERSAKMGGDAQDGKEEVVGDPGMD